MNQSIYITPSDKLTGRLPKRLSPESAYLFEGKGLLNILEIGSNRQDMKRYFTDKGHRYTGYDLTSNLADINGDMNFLPFDIDTFDAVLINSTLQYSWNPFLTLLEIRRVLKKSGFLTGTFPFLEPGIWKSLFHVTGRGLNELLRSTGFEVNSIWPCWNVIDALYAAIEEDDNVDDKSQILHLLKKVRSGTFYQKFRQNIQYAGGFHFYCHKTIN